jgi:ABC-2 type transport system permease protein
MDIYITIIILITSIIGIIFVAGKIFRVATLMQGKRPTFTELIQWIKIS